jgi:hypothetical protein
MGQFSGPMRRPDRLQTIRSMSLVTFFSSTVISRNSGCSKLVSSKFRKDYRYPLSSGARLDLPRGMDS